NTGAIRLAAGSKGVLPAGDIRCGTAPPTPGTNNRVPGFRLPGFVGGGFDLTTCAMTHAAIAMLRHSTDNRLISRRAKDLKQRPGKSRYRGNGILGLLILNCDESLVPRALEYRANSRVIYCLPT